MSVIAELSVSADELELTRLFGTRSGGETRLESVVPAGEGPIPYVWVPSRDAGAIEAALAESEGVEEVHRIDEIGDETLIRVVRSETLDGFVESIARADAAILDGVGRGDRWSFHLRFPEYDALSTFYRDVVEEGYSVELEDVHDPVSQANVPGGALSPEQREALSLAFEAGYFAVPREVTLVELAEELGISDAAVSQRIRRGLAEILADAFG